MILEKIQAEIKMNFRDKKFSMEEFLHEDVQKMIGRMKEKDEDGKMPLHLAARDIHDAEIIRNMIVLKADVHAKDDDGWTPLHYAAQFGSAADVKRLLDNGADVNAKNEDGWTPLHYAARENPDVEVARCLVEHGASIENEEQFGFTPFDFAFKSAKSVDVGMFFFDQKMGQKAVQVTDPKIIEKMKRGILWSETLGGAEIEEDS